MRSLERSSGKPPLSEPARSVAGAAPASNGGLTSIVIPVHNAAVTLADAIESSIGQGVAGDRLIVIDDGSTDGSAAVAERYRERVTLVRSPNGGPSRARNAGLSRVLTPYVLFLDADDVYEGPIVAGLEDAAARTDADIAFGTTRDVAPDGHRARDRQTPPDVSDPDAFVAAWLDGHSVQTNSHYWRTDFLRKIGGWDERMFILEEIETVARGVLSGARLAVSLEGTSLYRHSTDRTRVGYGASERVVRSAIEGFARLEPLAAGRPAVLRALGKRFYIQARTAFRLGYPGLGRGALERARALGFDGHTGTRGHRLLAGTLGLERKETLRRRLG